MFNLAGARDWSVWIQWLSFSLWKRVLFINLLNHHNGKVMDWVIHLIKMTGQLFVQMSMFYTWPVANVCGEDFLFLPHIVCYIVYVVQGRLRCCFTGSCNFHSKLLDSDRTFKDIGWAFMLASLKLWLISLAVPPIDGFGRVQSIKM